LWGGPFSFPRKGSPPPLFSITWGERMGWGCLGTVEAKKFANELGPNII